MYIYFALCRQDNTGDTTPRNTAVIGKKTDSSHRVCS
jgi:hypothetical protein